MFSKYPCGIVEAIKDNIKEFFIGFQRRFSPQKRYQHPLPYVTLKRNSFLSYCLSNTFLRRKMPLMCMKENIFTFR